MSKLRHFNIIILFSAAVVLAQGDRVRKPQPKDTLRLNHSLPYVYLEVDHIGPRKPYSIDESNVGIFLRLHNNCTVPIIIDTFVREGNNIGVFHNVVANSPLVGEPGGSIIELPKELPEMSHMDLSSIFGASAKAPQKSVSSPAENSVPTPVQSAVSAPMPAGYRFLYSLSKTLRPGQSIYFSLPLNHVSEKWHIEIPFRFDLRVSTPIRSPYNFVAFYEEDINLPAVHRLGSTESDAPKPTSTGNTIPHEPGHLEESPAH